MIKVYKALKVMEKQKSDEPKYSESLKDLVLYLYSIRDDPSQSLSRLSKLDLDTSSVFTGVGSAFNNFNALLDKETKRDI